eukprot:302408_1
MIGLSYYLSLNVSNNNIKNHDLLIKFCDIYVEFLNDWIHVKTIHSQQVEDINKELINVYQFSKCSIKNCQLTTRHYNANSNLKSNQEINSTFKFYRDIFDNIHFYLFHL